MPRITPLFSSSKGNSTYIGTSKSGILIDVGSSFRMLKASLDLCGIDFSCIKAVFITHEHSDHIGGLKMFRKCTDIPVYASAGTLRSMLQSGCIDSDDGIFDLSEIKNAPTDMEVTAFRTPHDSAESVGYTIVCGEDKIGYCTDLGEVTPTVRENLVNSRIVFIEANYQPEMLMSNPRYPAYLKKRISSAFGHLSNPDSADYIKELVTQGTSRVILGHLSQENNRPELAHNCVVERLKSAGMKLGSDYTLDVSEVRTSGRNIIF